MSKMASNNQDKDIVSSQEELPLSQNVRRNPSRSSRQTKKYSESIDDDVSISSSQKSNISRTTKGAEFSTSLTDSKVAGNGMRSRDKVMISKSSIANSMQATDALLSGVDSDCIKCEGTINDITKALRCDFCASWVCLHCTGLPERLYDLMMDQEVPNVLWTCDSCVHALPTIKNLGKTLQCVKDDQDVCKSEISRIDSKVDRLEDSIDSKIHEAIEDYRERESRKCNVIVHNVPESSKQDGKERMDEDKEKIKTMMKDGMTIEDVTINSIVRLGKREEGKTRLLKVVVDSVKCKRALLLKAKKLRETDTWKKVFITPDYSPKERQINKELRDQLKKRMEDGEEGLVIRRGKIITLHKHVEVTEEEVQEPHSGHFR